MLENLSLKISQKMIKYDIISKADEEVYSYGIYQFIMLLLNLVTSFLLGLLFQLLIPCIVLNISYILIRINAGGYHADSPLKCYINSTIIIAVLLAIIKWILFHPITLVVIFTVASIIIWFTAPVETENNPLDETEMNVYRKRSRFILLMEIIIFIALIICKQYLFAEIIALGISTESVMLLMGLVKNRFDLSKANEK